MKDSIYQMFDGAFVDLSKIVSVSRTYASDNDGWWVSAGFHVHYQLLEKSVRYHWRGDVKENASMRGSNVTWDDMPYIGSGEGNFEKWSPVLIERADVERVKLVDAWRDFNKPN